MSDRFRIAETKTFHKTISKRKYSHLYKKIEELIYPVLASNPYFGHNIKKLKGEFKDIYRYRIGDYRLFYKIDNKRVIVFIIDLKERKDAYR